MISPKRRKFLEAYLISFNAQAAAIEAGYSKASAHQRGSLLLREPEIRQELNKRCEEVIDKNNISLAYLLNFWRSTIEDDKASLASKLRASEMMAKYLGMFNSTLEITGKDGEPIKVVRGE